LIVESNERARRSIVSAGRSRGMTAKNMVSAGGNKGAERDGQAEHGATEEAKVKKP